jgi:hypothetical protein
MSNSRHYNWECLCDCGNTAHVSGHKLKTGKTLSCGCLAIERLKQRCTKHGQARTKEYYAWHHMLMRCTNPQTKQYEDYGGRGITVCSRWLHFEAFLADMGKCPDAYVLDRADNEGNYEHSNCAWVTRGESNNNRRNSTRYFGLSTVEIAEHLGVTRDVMKSRFQRNPELWVDIYE